MPHRHCARRVALALIALLFVSSHAVAQDFDKVEIQTFDLGPGVAMLQGAGGNIGVSFGDDGVFLIDDQFAPLTEKIIAAVRKLSDKPVRFLVNTHWHGDHSGGNENLGNAGTLIVAHDAVRERMSTEQFMAAFNRRTLPSPPAALPVITFGDDVTFHLNGDRLHVFHVAPAHTDGDSIVHFENANVIHMGDTYFNGMFPFFDLSSAGTVRGLLAAAERVLGMIDDDTRVIPGHGPLSNKAELRAYRDMLKNVIGTVSAAIQAGKTAEEIVASKPTASYDKAFSKGFLAPDDFVGLVAQSLSAEGS